MTKQELIGFINANYLLDYSIADYTQVQLENLLHHLEDEDFTLTMPDGTVICGLPI
jgi:hypothetical protein